MGWVMETLCKIIETPFIQVNSDMKRKSKGGYKVQMMSLLIRWVKWFFQGQMSYKNYNLLPLNFLTPKLQGPFSMVSGASILAMKITCERQCIYLNVVLLGSQDMLLGFKMKLVLLYFWFTAQATKETRALVSSTLLNSTMSCTFN